MATYGQPEITQVRDVEHAAPLADGRRCVVVGSGARLRLWDLARTRFLGALGLGAEVQVLELVPAPGSARLVVVQATGPCLLVDLDAGGAIRRLARSRRRHEQPCAAAWIDDGHLLQVARARVDGHEVGLVRRLRACDGEVLETTRFDCAFTRAWALPGEGLVLTAGDPARQRWFDGRWVNVEPTAPLRAWSWPEATELSFAGPPPPVPNLFWSLGQPFRGVAPARGGGVVVVSGDDDRIQTFQRRADQLVRDAEGTRPLALTSSHHVVLDITRTTFVPRPLEGRPAVPHPPWRPRRALGVAADHGGRRVAVANADRVEVWDEGEDAPSWQTPVRGGTAAGSTASQRLFLAQDGEWLITWPVELGPRIWQRNGPAAKAGSELLHNTLRFPDHPTPSPDGRWVASLRGRSDELMRGGLGRHGFLAAAGESRDWSEGRALRIRDPSSQEVDPFRGRLTVFSGPSGEVVADRFPYPRHALRALAISPDSQLLAIGTHLGAVGLGELPDVDPVQTLAELGRAVQGLAFDPAGRLLWVATRRRRARARAGSHLLALDLRDGRVAVEVEEILGRSVTRLLMSPCRPVLAALLKPTDPSRGWRVALRRFEISTTASGRRQTRVTGRAHLGAHPGAITDLAFSLDGGRLVVGDADGVARVWDVDAVLADP